MLQKWRKTTHLVSDNGIVCQLCENKMSVPVPQVYFWLWILLTNASILFWKSDVLLLFSLKCLLVWVIRSEIDTRVRELTARWAGYDLRGIALRWYSSSSACLDRSGRVYSRWFPGNNGDDQTGQEFPAIPIPIRNETTILHCWKRFMTRSITKSY